MKKGVVAAILAATACAAVWLVVPYVLADNEKPLPEDIPAARVIADPYPAFNGIAVDPDNNLVVTSDPNRKSLLLYDRIHGSSNGAASVPIRQITGPETYLGMISGTVVDPSHREIYVANNDIEDTVVVMPYDALGNVKPARVFSVPHQAWGLALSHQEDQLAITVEVQNAVVFYRRDVRGVEAPMRVIHGPATGLADPHGIYWDDVHKEIGVANHGNFRGLVKDMGAGCIPSFDFTETDEYGKYQPPSIGIYAQDAKDNAKPLRKIQGTKTQLDWPMGIAEDPQHNTIVVANNGDNSILVFDQNKTGDVAPLRIIRGDRTGINRPMGIAVDAKNGEIWVSNFIDHSAVAFDARASGNTPPKRVIRSAPAGTPTPGFGNPMALSYDCKREQILVPNCVTQPRIAAFRRLANGTVAPTRVITGQRTKLGRTIHGLAYDSIHDEIVVPNPLADAILVFRGDANGEEAPIRVIQGPLTRLVTPHAVSLDLKNGEILVAGTGRQVSVFAWNANGNVAPLRMLKGPKTKIGHPVGLAVDDDLNLLAVANTEGQDILIFNRTDNGDVAPRARIAGPHTGITDEPWGMEAYKGKIFLAASNHLHKNLYSGVTLVDKTAEVPYDPWLNPVLGFIGVWNFTDNGDVPPSAMIRGPFSGLLHPTGVALDPKDGEVYATDSIKNGVLSFLVPDFFKSKPQHEHVNEGSE